MRCRHSHSGAVITQGRGAAGRFESEDPFMDLCVVARLWELELFVSVRFCWARLRAQWNRRRGPAV
eukprot:3951871-Prymnesium_polylepis.1